MPTTAPKNRKASKVQTIHGSPQKYRFRAGRSSKVPAQVIGERLDALEQNNQGVVTPKQVVRDARPEDAPLHPHFTWDDWTAAEKYREQEARDIITAVELVAEGETEDDKGTSIPFRVSIGDSGNTGAGYVRTVEAFSNVDWEAKVLEKAYSALQGWINRYGYLQEFTLLREVINSQFTRYRQNQGQVATHDPSSSDE